MNTWPHKAHLVMNCNTVNKCRQTWHVNMRWQRCSCVYPGSSGQRRSTDCQTIHWWDEIERQNCRQSLAKFSHFNKMHSDTELINWQHPIVINIGQRPANTVHGGSDITASHHTSTRITSSASVVLHQHNNVTQNSICGLSAISLI